MNKNLISAVLFCAIFGAIPLSPTFADTGTAQDSRQTSVITGTDSSSYQRTNQDSKTERDGFSRTEVGIQKQDQYCDIVGERNICVQESDQRSVIRPQRRVNNR